MSNQVAVFTSRIPDRLAKRWSIVDGVPTKDAAGEMVSGRVDVVDFDGLNGFASVLSGLSVEQALTYGLPNVSSGEVMTRRKWTEAGRPSGVVTRTKQSMTFRDGPGIMMIDYDPPKGESEPVTHEDLFAMLVDACPSLAGVGYVAIPSASSMIYNGDTEIVGLRGQRLYFEVKNAVAIPEAGSRLFELLFAAGHGWVEVSKSGALLKRTIIDKSVWQSNRFDFAAGAVCEPPLNQRRGKPVVVSGRMLDCIKDIPKLTPKQQQKYLHAVDVAEQEKSSEASVIASAYREHLGREMAGPGATTKQIQDCIEQVREAVDKQTLMGDMRVIVFDEGEWITVKVVDILDEPERYHGLLTLDPLETDYDGKRPVGKLYLLGRAPCLKSFAHGGRTFRLCRSPEMVLLTQGKTADAVNESLKKMRESREVFDRGGLVSMVSGDKIIHLRDGGMLYWLGSRCQFYSERYNEKKDEMTTTLKDPPTSLVKMIDQMGAQRDLPKLKRISSHPVIMQDGAVIDSPGYHEASEILFNFDEDQFTPPTDAPTMDDAIAAYHTIMEPFRFFPFVDAIDRTALFSAVMSAVLRPVISTCPAFAFDAPVQGSGKTLLAKAIGAIATGKAVEVTPHVSGRDDEEIRKRIMAILKDGAEAVIWDNIMGVFNSASMAGMLTSMTYSDRLLGASDKVSFPNSALWLLTGNNLQLSGDLPRRVIRCRIDPHTDQPFAREFEFDPEAYCIQRRMDIVAAVITIASAWFTDGKPLVKGTLASFEEWDHMVRQPVAWLAGGMQGELVDPMEIIKDGQEMDAEQADWAVMLSALYRHFDDGIVKFTVKDLMVIYEKVQDRRFNDINITEEEIEIHDAIADCSGRKLSGRSVGKMLSFRVDRIVNELVLRKMGKGRHGQVWAVERLEKQRDFDLSKVTQSHSQNCETDKNVTYSDEVPF